jgi:hypothetical protein
MRELKPLWDKANQKWNSLSPRNQKIGAIIIVFCFMSLLGSLITPSPTPKPQQASAPAPALTETALGLIGDQGITLWMRSDGCLIAKGVDDRRLRILGQDRDSFKQILKDRYNRQCLYFE